MYTDSFITLPGGIRLFARTAEAIGRADAPTLLVPNGIIFLDDLAPLRASHRIVAYDLRNRGASDPAPHARGIPDDVADLEHVRQALGLGRCATLAHSYVAVVVARHAMLHPDAIDRVVMIGAPPPHPAATYPPELAYADDVLARAFAEVGRVQASAGATDPVELFRRVWHALRPIYVIDQTHVDKLRWDRSELPNEHTFMAYWTQTVAPSLAALAPTDADFAAVTRPVLVVHGRKDRSAPFGGALDWVARLPAARLVEAPQAAHAPWVEDAAVLPAIARFLAEGHS